MQFTPLRWLVLFFTKPVRLTRVVQAGSAPDLPASAPLPKAMPIAQSDSPRPEAWFAQETIPSAVEVSEQPLDTLPGELQDQLLGSSAAKTPQTGPPP